jgi:hypothetical protein
MGWWEEAYMRSYNWNLALEDVYIYHINSKKQGFPLYVDHYIRLYNYKFPEYDYCAVWGGIVSWISINISVERTSPIFTLPLWESLTSQEIPCSKEIENFIIVFIPTRPWTLLWVSWVKSTSTHCFCKVHFNYTSAFAQVSQMVSSPYIFGHSTFLGFLLYILVTTFHLI